MNINTRKELTDNGFYPQLVEHLDRFLNHCCWDYDHLSYIHGEILSNNREISYDFIQTKMATIEQELASKYVRSSYTWVKSAGAEQMTKIQFIIAMEPRRKPWFDEMRLAIINNSWSPYSPKIIDTHQGRFFGYSRKISQKTVEQYEILAEKLLDFAWDYQSSLSRGQDFGGSSIKNPKRLQSLFPMYKQGNIRVDALTGEIGGEGGPHHPWTLGDQICSMF